VIRQLFVQLAVKPLTAQQHPQPIQQIASHAPAP
jgi:hypothetical protein